MARLGDYDRAEAGYAAALAHNPTEADRRRIRTALLALAQARNNLVQAQKQTAILEALPGVDKDRDVALRIQLVRGAMAFRSGDLAEARRAFSLARPIAEELKRQGNPGGTLGLYECLSYECLQSFGARGRPAPAEYQQAYRSLELPGATLSAQLWPLDIYRSLYWTRLWIWQAWEYSYLAYRRNDLAQAGEWAVVSNQIGDQAAQLYWKTYAVNQDNELFTATLHSYLELTEGFPELPTTPQILDLLAPIFEKFAQTPTTERSLLQGRYHRSLARYQFYARKQPDVALQEYQLATEWMARGGYPIDRMDILLETAYVYLLDRAPPSWEKTVETNLQELRRLSEEVCYPVGRYYGLGLSGVLQARRGQTQAGEALLRACFDQLREWSQQSEPTPQARKQQWERPEVKLFGDTLVEILIQQGRTQEALEATQSLTAAAESAGLDLARVVPKKAQTGRDLQSILKTRQQVGQLTAQLQSAQIAGDQAATSRIQGLLADNRADFVKTINRLRQHDPDFERVLSVRPSSFAKLQPQLPPQVVVVEYYPSQDKLFLFAVTRTQLRIFSVPLGRDELYSKVRGLRRKIAARQVCDDDLYASLIQPLGPILQDHKILAIIPAGPLYYLPFSALRGTDGKYLAEIVSVCVLTATEFPQIGTFAAAVRPRSLLALANPDGSLPGATREADMISKLFVRSTRYVGEKATKDKLTRGSDVIHIATHGTLDAQDVNESYLLMAGPDKRLTTGEIYSLDLSKVGLVTLSACQTALGEANPGSEVASLAQAFSVAGSQSMLASLWQVEDDSTAALMVAFYGHLLAGNSKAEALRQAQRDIMKQPRWRHPFFWAAFELIGDWN
jgi:CHAT domain-containing protein